MSQLSRQYICCSLRCSWSIACRRCSNYIFILDLTPGLNALTKTTARQETKHLSFGIVSGAAYTRDFTVGSKYLLLRFSPMLRTRWRHSKWTWVFSDISRYIRCWWLVFYAYVERDNGHPYAQHHRSTYWFNAAHRHRLLVVLIGQPDAYIIDDYDNLTYVEYVNLLSHTASLFHRAQT